MPHIKYLCVLLLLAVLTVRHMNLSLHIWASLKGIATQIWSFGCGFACATIMGCLGFKISFGIIILL